MPHRDRPHTTPAPPHCHRASVAAVSTPDADVQTRGETIVGPDGVGFAAHIATPAGDETRPGVVVIQEIFGVNTYLRDVCDRLARLGYVALAPDMFHRLEPGVRLENQDDADLQTGIGYAMRFDGPQGVADLGAALAHVRSLPECNGKAGVVGFCFGGTFAYLSAVHLDPDAAVSYYGSGVADAIGDISKVACPLLFHFGDSDPFIPNEQVATIEGAIAGFANVDLVVHAGGGHAFDNSFSHFSQPAPAAAAWSRTTDFLAAHLC